MQHDQIFQSPHVPLQLHDVGDHTNLLPQKLKSRRRRFRNYLAGVATFVEALATGLTLLVACALEAFFAFFAFLAGVALAAGAEAVVFGATGAATGAAAKAVRAKAVAIRAMSCFIWYSDLVKFETARNYSLLYI
jgi:hypothetical protein